MQIPISTYQSLMNTGDVGTGSGAISVCLRRGRSGWSIFRGPLSKPQIRCLIAAWGDEYQLVSGDAGLRR